MRKIFISAFCLAALAAQTNKFALTIDNIMRGPALYGYEPRALRWSGAGDRIYFQWKQSGDPVLKDFDTYVVNREGGGLRKLTDEESKLAPPAVADRSADHRRAVYALDGDLFLYDYTSDTARRLTDTRESESAARFLRDGKRITFTRSGNLYGMSLEGPAVVQYTDIRPAAAASPSAAPAVTESELGQGETQGRTANSCPPEPERGRKATGNQDFLKKEASTVLEIVKQRQEKCDDDSVRKNRGNPRKPYTLAPRQSVAALQLSPDEKYVIAMIAESAEGRKTTLVPNFVSLSGYTEDIGSRSKAGDPQPRIRMAAISTGTGELKWLEHGLKQNPAADANPAAQQPERAIQFFGLQWPDAGSDAFVQGRASDNKDYWIFAVDPAAAKLRVIAARHDDAWISNIAELQAGWMKGGREIYFISDQDGYRHLYNVPFESGPARQITSGKWEVLSAALSRDKSRFFLTTNEGDPADRHFDSMSPDGGPRERLTSVPGHSAAVPSPDEKYLAIVYSYVNQPPEVYVQENSPGAQARKLTSSPAPEFHDYAWKDTPIVRIPARDGAELPAHLYKPSAYRRGGPAVIFVHGAGYLQNVHHGWSSSYSREYLFHHFLMENGYLVLDVDYRGSAGYGRDWRTGIYRHMGGKDLEDQVDAARWLVSRHGVDARRIGLYGGSYGGFITLMARFTQPDVFAAGAALRPVTDWAHYNHPYTSNILNIPQDDAEAYRRSSPIYFAAGLKGALLICHGMVDTNVHFQDTVRITQKLIELRKENWELAVYPAEDHAFQQPSSWADEYKRIFRLFEQNLKKR
ncbi:MAG TPA: prolyl oligopeptidase family serine peptidase [Bryobacteraceae bacterium]|nr:prolyl oligopeptidase family serine peptidase [Bryobacteraceae bacterium]